MDGGGEGPHWGLVKVLVQPHYEAPSPVRKPLGTDEQLPALCSRSTHRHKRRLRCKELVQTCSDALSALCKKRFIVVYTQKGAIGRYGLRVKNLHAVLRDERRQICRSEERRVGEECRSRWSP